MCEYCNEHKFEPLNNTVDYSGLEIAIWCNGCTKVAECPYKEHKDCVREHFEKLKN